MLWRYTRARQTDHSVPRQSDPTQRRGYGPAVKGENRLERMGWFCSIEINVLKRRIGVETPGKSVQGTEVGGRGLSEVP